MASIKKYAAKRSKKGYKWKVQYRDATGAGRTKQGFDTKDQAEDWAANNTVEMNTDEWISPEDQKTRVEELWPRWWRSKEKDLEPSSSRALQSSWNTHVKPRWGGLKVGDVKPDEVQDWVDDLAERRSASVVHRAVEILRALMSDAVRFRKVKRNPVRDVRLPPRAKKKPTTITEKQLHALVEEAARFKSLLLFLGCTGARWGEAVALTVGDIDVKRQRADINKNAPTIHGKVVLGDPKSHEIRKIGVPQHVLDAMKPDLKDKLPTALVWTNQKGTHLTTPSRRSWFHGALDRARAQDQEFPEITPHDLRHAAASILISRGASVLVVQRQLGHASAKMTLDVYAHAFEDDLDAVIRGVVGLSWDSEKEQGSSSSGA